MDKKKLYTCRDSSTISKIFRILNGYVIEIHGTTNYLVISYITLAYFNLYLWAEKCGYSFKIKCWKPIIIIDLFVMTKEM